MGLIQPVEGLNRTKRLTVLQGRLNSSCITSLQLRHQFSPAFGLKWKHQLYLGPKPLGLCTGTTASALLVLMPLNMDRELCHWFFWVSSLLTLSLWNCQPLTCASQFLKINLFTHTYTCKHMHKNIKSTIGSVSLKNQVSSLFFTATPLPLPTPILEEFGFFLSLIIYAT